MVEESELFCPRANGNHCLSYSSCLISVCCCGNAAVLLAKVSQYTETRRRARTDGKEEASEGGKLQGQKII